MSSAPAAPKRDELVHELASFRLFPLLGGPSKQRNQFVLAHEAVEVGPVEPLQTVAKGELVGTAELNVGDVVEKTLDEVRGRETIRDGSIVDQVGTGVLEHPDGGLVQVIGPTVRVLILPVNDVCPGEVVNPSL